MVDDKLITLIKSLHNNDKNSFALLELLNWCCKRSLSEVTQEEAEIFYILYKYIVKD